VQMISLAEAKTAWAPAILTPTSGCTPDRPSALKS
jgi:hypothetical protein